MSKKTIVYIAGKMAGLPDKGKQDFMTAQKKLEEAGYIVLNPAVLPDGMEPDQYMPICLAMVEQADCVFLLPTAMYSKGAMIEEAYADYQGKPVFRISDLEKE